MSSFKLGRLPGVIPVGLHDLTYYAAGPLPPAPPNVAAPVIPEQSDGTPWGVLSNDVLGCCGPAGLVHGYMTDAAETGEHENFPTAEQVAAYYLRYTGGQDSGVVLSDFLAYVHRHRFDRHTVSAYAPVTVQDVPTLQFATWAFDFCYTGIVVTNGMMDAVQGPGPWEWTTADLGGGEAGGHCVPIVGYDDTALIAVTWGNLIRISYPAWHRIAEEAWAVIPGELKKAKSDGHGISLSVLVADLNRLQR